MDDGKRSGTRRLKDRLASLLRPAANSLLRSTCGNSTSSTASAALTATTTNASTTAISTSSTDTTAATYTTASAGALVPGAEPFSAALDRLRRPPMERSSKAQHKEGFSSSSRHSSRRRSKNVDIGKGGVRTLASNPYGFTSSDDDEEEDGTFFGHSDDDDDTATALFSSRSLMASDSSGFYTSNNKLQPHKNKSHHTHHRRPRRRRAAASCVETCDASAVCMEPGFRPLVLATAPPATAEAAAAQVRKGLAVVKRSRDPYGDFRESMVEMIVCRQVFGAAELERLLRSYLSLNAPRLHPVILQAFSDIWVVLHGG